MRAEVQTNDKDFDQDPAITTENEVRVFLREDFKIAIDGNHTKADTNIRFAGLV